jgi:hypothetical protein
MLDAQADLRAERNADLRGSACEATASRGISEGVWGYAGDHTVAALYWFYRYNPDGTFASRASVTD